VAKILVVDDIVGIRSMLTHALDDAHQVSQATNGQEAVRLAEAERPDVIIMDLDMPVMDGVEATRLIKTNPSLSGIRVLAITGQRNSERSRQIRDWCDAFIEKPFRLNELRETVERLVAESHPGTNRLSG
jgi:CheY-like chemotaxis protein